MSGSDSGSWGGTVVQPGQTATVELTISEGYSGREIKIPVFIWRGQGDGPTVAVTAAVHGDEINGTGTIRHIIRDRPFELVAGMLVLVPVVNMPGFERHSRYLPDRRDLNRSFPGSPQGSLASRLARSFFDQVIERSDYVIDLHTAAVRRTNFPNVRGDMRDPRVAELARAFGVELVVAGKGPRGSLRAAACKAGRPTVILEAGEVWKVEPGVVEYAVRGIRNCLISLGMVEGEPFEPPYRIETDSSTWIRAEHGGFLEFHVAPGDIVAKGDQLATNTGLTGDEHGVIVSPRDGIILGMTTLPAVSPGGPVCHIAYPRRGTLRRAERAIEKLDDSSLHERLRDDLATNVLVTDADEDSP